MELDQSSVPVDKGWAWVVLAGCVLEITVYGGIMRSFGVFFIQFQIRFQSSTYETAVMGLVQNATLSICSVFVMTVGLKKFSSRVSVFSGGVLTVIGFLITAFTADLWVYYFGQGFLLGLGMSLIHAPELAIIGAYFNKHKALANGIFAGGAEIGGLIFAPIIVKLFDTYQYTGAMLIVSGLLMHIMVGALLMRPPEFYTKMRTDVENAAEKEYVKSDFEDKWTADVPNSNIVYTTVNSKSDSKFENSDEKNANLFRSLDTLSPKNKDDGKSCDTFSGTETIQTEPLIRSRAHSVGSKLHRPVPHFDRISENNVNGNRGKLRTVMDVISKSQVALFASSEGVCIPVLEPGSTMQMIDMTENANGDEENPGCLSSVKIILESILRTVFDLHLLKNPAYLCFLLLTFAFHTGHTIVPNFIPTHAKEIGISNDKIGIQIAVLSAVSLFAKIFIGIVVDRKWMRWSTVLALMAFITGTSCHLLRFVNSFAAILVYVVIIAFCSGQFHSLYAVILLEVIGHEKFKSSLGFGTLVLGASSAVFFPVSGKLRDLHGSYVAPYHLLGGLAYFSVFLVLLIPRIKTMHDARKREDV